MAGSSDFKTEQSQMVSIEALLSSTYHKMELNQCTKSLASCVAISSLLSACQGKMEPFKEHLDTRGHLTGPRNSHAKSRLIIFWQCYTAGELVYGFSYRSNTSEKCFSVCVPIRVVLANLVITYVLFNLHFTYMYR